MKRNTPEHPKTLALMKALSISRLAALGLLEALWHFTARYAPQGDIGRWSDDHIANGVYWESDPGAMLAGLVASGWVDECRQNRFVIHDWADHMDEATKKALARKGLKVARVSRHVRTTADNGGKRQPAVAVARALPEPEPEPTDAALPARRTWLTPYAQAWTEAYGGAPIMGKLAKSLRPLDEAHGPGETLTRWLRYLSETPAEYASAAKFSETFGRWAFGNPGGALVRAGPQLTAKADARRQSMAAAIAGGLKGDGTLGGES